MRWFGDKISRKELFQLRTDIPHLSNYPARVLMVVSFKCRGPGGQPRKSHRKVNHPSELSGWSWEWGSKQQKNTWAAEERYKVEMSGVTMEGKGRNYNQGGQMESRDQRVKGSKTPGCGSQA